MNYRNHLWKRFAKTALQILKLILLAVGLFSWQTVLGEDTIQGKKMIKYFYQILLDSSGEPYLDAEQQLISQGDAAIPFLRAQLQHASPLSKLITEVVLERIQGNDSFKESVTYFDQVERRAAQTPMGVPPPEAVADYLHLHFGDKVSPLLGVYLLKLGHIWPAWKTLGVILYLGKLNSSSSAEVLIQFLALNTNAHYRKIAVEALVAVGDAAVLNKLEVELKEMAAKQDGLQQALNRIKKK